MRWRLALLIVVLLATPASALDATFRLTSWRSVALDGDVTVATSSGLAHGFDEAAESAFVLTLGTGSARVVEWRHDVAQTNDGDTVYLTTDGPFITEIEGSELAFTLTREFLELVAEVGTEGTVRVEGSFHGEGTPIELVEDSTGHFAAGPTSPLPRASAPDVDWRCAAGRGYVGPAQERDPEGFPAVAAALLVVEGQGRLKVRGGNVSWMAEDGPQDARLGVWTETTGIAAVGRRTIHDARLVVEGDDLHLAVPGVPIWGLCGDAFTWTVDGEATWTDASGEAATASGSRHVEHQTIRAEGLFDARVVPSAPLATPLAPVSYEGSGSFERFDIAGAPLTPATPQPSVVPVAVTSGLTALLALLAVAWWVLVPLYTRLAPARLLEHPRRRVIYEHVVANPGVYNRELQRAVGGEWGTFAFHLRTLVTGGYLRVERQGPYALVFPVSAPRAGGPVIPHPVTRRVFDAVPSQGIVRFADLQKVTGLSRQLLSHHVRALENKGLLRVAHHPGRSRDVARADAGGDRT